MMRMFLFLLALPFVAAAQTYPIVTCTGLVGCGQNPEDLIMTGLIPTAGGVLITLAGGGAVVAIVVAGVQMATSYADEGKISSARKAILYALGGLGVAISANSLVTFIVSQNEFGQSEPDLLVGVLSTVVRFTLIFSNVAFIIIAILAGIRMVTAAGNADEFKKGGQMILWAVIGGVLVNVAKSLVQAFLALQL